MPVTRGFKRRQGGAEAPPERIPPGQFVTTEFPVLTAGPTQHTPVEQWSLSLQHNGRIIASWNWAQFTALPQTQRTTDIHCVTKWSRFDTRWQGVTFDELMKAAGLEVPSAPYVMAHCDGGYTTNLPVADLRDGKGMIATHFDDMPIAPTHGGPARLLVPHLYFWKSAKWVRSLEFMATNTPGFWESMGYHLYGDPWREQRYTGDP
jgi:DMSO/TMAO reductase YedYZ molybdopterin-dependent catalytic subunit